MTELVWFELHPPRELAVDELVRLVRVLAGRPRVGVQRLTPLVCFELHLRAGGPQWLLGVEQQMSGALPHELTAQMPGLHLARRDDLVRPLPITGRELRFDGLAFPLRLDTAAAVSRGLLQAAKLLGGSDVLILQWLVGPSNDRRRQPGPLGLLGSLGLVEREPGAADRAAWKAKVVEPLFDVRGRIGVVTSDQRRAAVLLRSLIAALSLASGPSSPLRPSPQSSRIGASLHHVHSRRRSWSSLLNAAELAAVLGWPVERAGRELVGLRLAPVPTALLLPDDGEPQGQRILGTSTHPASQGRPVLLPEVTSRSHLHVIGPTGTGKSTLLAGLALADAIAGRALVVIEPKGDLVDDIVRRLPKERADDLILLEPTGGARSVGFNPLAGPVEDAERRADELLSLFRQLFGSAIGPRSADVLLHALLTAARLPGGCLTDIPTLLTNPAFRRAAVGATSDPLVLGPFWAGFETRSETERAMVVAPLLNKLRVFTSRPAVRHMLSQAAPPLSLDAVLSERRILLVNLNRGQIGPETAGLLGSLLLLQLWRAIQRRATLPAAERAPAMVIVDEWQDYAAALDFGDVFATARGLGVGLTVAHQHLGQLSAGLQAAVLANARSRVAFRPAQRDLTALAAVLGDGVGAEDLDQLPSYHAAARVLVGAVPPPAFTIATLPLARSASSGRRLRAASLRRYGVETNELDEALAQRWNGETSSDSTNIGRRRRS